MSTKRKAEPEGHSRLTDKLHGLKSGSSKRDSEQDSGLSDTGSERIHARDPTDSECSSSLGAQGALPPSTPKSGSGSQAAQVAVLGGSYSGLSPMILMNNVLLKRPCDTPPALKPWGFRPAVEVVQPVVPQPQMVLIQSVVSHQSPSVPKGGSGKRRRPKKYLPILKSYPKIAPHPGDGSSSSGRGSLSPSPSLSGSVRGRSLPSSHMKRRYRDKHHRQQRHLPGSGSSTPTPSLLAPPSPCPSPSTTPRLALPAVPVNDSSTCSSPAFSRSNFSPSPSVAPSSHDGEPAPSLSLPDPDREDKEDGDPQGQKRMRFCNTYNILSQSGLLDITLRTKELIRQNRRTQSDLDRLKDDTRLFVQALQSGDAKLWGQLQSNLLGEDGEKEKETATES